MVFSFSDFTFSQFDLMEKIGEEVVNIREREKNKQKYNIVIKHLGLYLYYDYHSCNKYKPDLYCDTEFVEKNQNDISQDMLELIIKSHGYDKLRKFRDFESIWYRRPATRRGRQFGPRFYII